MKSDLLKQFCEKYTIDDLAQEELQKLYWQLLEGNPDEELLQKYLPQVPEQVKLVNQLFSYFK